MSPADQRSVSREADGEIAHQERFDNWMAKSMTVAGFSVGMLSIWFMPDGAASNVLHLVGFVLVLFGWHPNKRTRS